MNKHDLNNKIFITILLIISYTFSFCIFRNSKTTNMVDNRSSYRFTIPKINELLSGKYQNNMDQTIADQMPKYNYFKLLYLKITNYTNIKTIKTFNLSKYDKYINLGSVYLYNDYLLYGIDSNKELIDKGISSINNIIKDTNSNIYFYYINTDKNYNFETEYKNDEYEYIKNKLSIDDKNISYLNINSFDDYSNYFYKTDHHWNHEGSYHGYTDIAKMMNLDVIEAKDKTCLNNTFSGSKLKAIAGLSVINETPCIYEFDLPDFEIYINGEKSNYGSSIEDIKNNTTLTYGYIYGGDYAEIKFINDDSTNDKKLLIISNSYSNSINKLLASNYKETYVIDGRYYNEKNMIDYIKDNDIDDVLIIASNMLLSDNVNW